MFLILIPSFYIFISTSFVFLVLIFPTEALTCFNCGLSIGKNMALSIACQLVCERKHSFLHGREFSYVSQNNDFPSKRRTGHWLSIESSSAKTKNYKNHLIQLVGEQRIAVSEPQSLSLLVRKKKKIAPPPRLVVSKWLTDSKVNRRDQLGRWSTWWQSHNCQSASHSV